MKNFVRFFLLLIVMVAVYACDPLNHQDEYPQALPVAGLVVHIPFNGDAFERISNTTGSIVKATFVPNRKNQPGSAVHFNRSDSAFIDFGDLEQASFVNGVFSISCWVFAEDTVLPGAILSKRGAGGDFEYSLDNHFWSKAYYTFDNWVANGSTTVYGIDPLQAKSPVKPGEWQHLVYVADGSRLRVFTNGVVQAGIDLKQAGQFSNTPMPFVVGNGGGFQKYYYFQGAIDDIRIYNRVLTHKEVQALYMG
jgi:hypothetical protein